jgi:flagellar biosynthetic protein FlhB
MASGSEEKTEKPTAKKNKENRKEGQVPRSQEIGGWSALLLFAMFLPAMVGRELDAMRDIMTRSFTGLDEADPAHALQLLGSASTHALLALVLLGSAVLLVGVAGALSQGGFYLATKAVKPSAKKLNPITGFKRVFGTQALWEGAKVLVKSALVAILVYTSIQGLVPMVGRFYSVESVLDRVTSDVVAMVRWVAVLGVLMAAADYLFQRHKVGKQTRMTKQEVKQEHKNSEGDPLLKGAIRSRQLAVSRNRMIADTANADVVLVNPTHVAIALTYPDGATAPVVTARGAGAIATRIREVATEHRVPLVQDVPLARALYRSARVGQQIPPELFAAVAQVLAFVISRKRAGQAAGEHRSPRGDEPLPEVLPAGRRRPRNPSADPPPGR